MKIALIQPSSFHAWEALGLGYIASYLKAHGYHNLVFYSGFFDSDEEIIEGCWDADLIGFSCTSPQMKHALSLATQIKHGGNYIVFGGSHPSALPEETLKNECIDAVVVGEGESAFLDIARGNRNKIVKHPYIENLDLLPFPDRKLIKQERNIQIAYSDTGERIGSLLTTRGCPYRCAFCGAHQVWQRKLRYRSPDSIMDEFERLVEEWNIDFVKFADDTFGTNKRLAMELCQAIIRRGRSTPWGCNIRVNIADDEMFSLMREAGCREVWAGVESGSPRILKEMKKDITIEQIRQFYKRTEEMGFLRRAYLLLGMPSEGYEDIRQTEELVDEIHPDFVGFSILAPYPGTEFYNPNIHSEIDWSVVDTYGNHITRTDYLSNEDLHREERRLVEKYHSKLVFRQQKAWVVNHEYGKR